MRSSQEQTESEGPGQLSISRGFRRYKIFKTKFKGWPAQVQSIFRFRLSHCMNKPSELVYLGRKSWKLACRDRMATGARLANATKIIWPVQPWVFIKLSPPPMDICNT